MATRLAPATIGRRAGAGADRPGDRGSGTMLAIAAIIALATASLAAVLLGYAIAARHRSAAAADLAALAGAMQITGPTQVAGGRAAACQKAAAVSKANGAELTSCTVVGEITEVVATVRLPSLFGIAVTARSRARAGPDDKDEAPSIAPDSGRRHAGQQATARRDPGCDGSGTSPCRHRTG